VRPLGVPEVRACINHRMSQCDSATKTAWLAREAPHKSDDSVLAGDAGLPGEPRRSTAVVNHAPNHPGGFCLLSGQIC
jgi:hypothetical protein